MAMISSNLGDVSFSWFLNSTDETFVRNVVTESSRIIKSNHEEDGEIGVFSADKYFKGNEETSSTNTSASKYRKEQQHSTKPKIFTTPIVASESSSSWHSQIAFLPKSSNTVLKNPPSRKQNKYQQGSKGGTGSFLAILGCKCYCSDKNSIDVVEDDKDHITDVSVKKGLNNHTDILKSRIDQVVGKEEVLPRQSLEVFGSPAMDKTSRSLSLERRLTMLSSSSTPMIEKINDDGDDNYSDASSDLFEIESVTGKVKSIFLTRQESPAESITSSCVTPTTCYAPSEASIEWSVVTASAADYEDLRPPTTTTSRTRIKPISPIKGRRSSNTLLGCKNQKAVGVAEDAYRMRTNNYNIFEPKMMTRFQTETKLTARKSHISN